MAMKALALIPALALAACGSGDGAVTSISLGDGTYLVPSAQILSVSREPHQFVRIKPPEHSFELVHDSRSAARTDQFGWPVIFSLNDETAPSINRHARDGLMVVCREAVNPRGGCGLKVSHRGAEWAVLFPRAQFGAAEAIREQALALLDAYEH